MPDNEQVTDNATPLPVIDEAAKKLAYERDTASAEAQKLRKELDALKNKLPSDDQVKHWKELEAASEKAEEDRKKKAGEFDSLRQQLVDKHKTDLAEQTTGREAAERELNDTLIGLAFAGASDLFGPTALTVLMPDVAMSYFGKQVSVETDEQGGRRVVVKDSSGHTVLNPETGRPAAFNKAIADVINAHPQKDHLLRGSGRTGSGSSGGAQHTPGGKIDFSRLTAKDFARPEVQAAVRERTAASGGIVMGKNFEKAGR